MVFTEFRSSLTSGTNYKFGVPNNSFRFNNLLERFKELTKSYYKPHQEIVKEKRKQISDTLSPIKHEHNKAKLSIAPCVLSNSKISGSRLG